MARPQHAPPPARASLIAFAAAGVGALACTPGAWLGGLGTSWLLLQMLLTGVCFGAASVHRHATRRFGERPGERAPIEVAPPRRAERDVRSRTRLAATIAMLLSALYFLTLVGLVVANAVR